MKKWIVFLIVCLSIATLVAVYAQAPSKVPEPPSEPAVNPPESNGEGMKVDIPKWWCWPREDFQKFQECANQTEVIWTYNSEGKKIEGTVMVAGEPLFKEYSSGLPGEFEEDAFYGFIPDSISPVEYLDGKRKGNCGGVSIICYCLFITQGENVILTSAQTVNNETGEPGLTHTWLEWTDIENNQWVIESGKVMPLENWYQSNDWTHSWVQWKPGEYEIYRDGTIIYFDS